MTSDRRYTAREVCRLALVTTSDLKWWTEHLILRPETLSNRAIYPEHEVMLAMLYRELRERGLLLSDFARVVVETRHQHARLPDPSRRWLLTDGTRVIFLEHEDVVLRFMEQRRNPAFVLIPLAPLAARLAVEVLPEKVGPAMEANAGESREAKRA